MVFAAADENCITDQGNCGPKKDENGVVKITIGKENDKESNIYDIIPEFRYLNDDKAKEKYFKDKLFPEALKIIKSKLNIGEEDFNKLSNDKKELNKFEEKVERLIYVKDIFNKLIISDEDKKVSLFNNDNDLLLYLYPIIYGNNDDNIDDDSENDSVISYIDNDENNSFTDNTNSIGNNKNLFLKKVNEYFNTMEENEKEEPLDFIDDKNISNNLDICNDYIDSEILKSLLFICKRTKSCGDRYFKGKEYNRHQFSIVRITKGENDYYHLIVKDSDNKKISHPLTIKKRNIEDSEKKDNTEIKAGELKYNKETEIDDLIYERDINYDIKEIMYYKYFEIPNTLNLVNELENIGNVKNFGILKEEVKNIINNFFKYDDNDGDDNNNNNDHNGNNNGNTNEKIKYIRDGFRNKIIDKLNDRIDNEMTFRYGKTYKDEDLENFINSSEYKIFIESNIDDILNSAFIDNTKEGIINNEFVEKLNDNISLKNGENVNFNEIENVINIIEKDYGIYIENDDKNKQKINKILYKIIFNNYNELKEKKGNVDLLKSYLYEDKGFKMIFYNTFVENLKNKLYEQNFDIFNKISNKDSEKDIKDKIGEVIISTLTIKNEGNDNDKKEMIINKEKDLIKDKIYIALKDKLETNKEETIKNIVRKMLVDTIKNMKLDDETVEKIFNSFYSGSRNFVFTNSDDDINTLKIKLKNMVQVITANIELNFDKQIINILENSNIESGNIQSLINKIKDKNKGSDIKLKDLIDSLNKELEKNKKNIKDIKDDKGNYILNETKVKEQFNKDLVESFCDKLTNNSKYKSNVLEEIIKNNYTTEKIVCRKAINDLVNSITVINDDETVNLNENIFKQIKENKNIIEDNNTMMNDIFEELLKVTKFEPTKQYLLRYMTILVNNLLTLKLNNEKLSEQVGNKVEDLFREDKLNHINNNDYKNYDDFIKKINYNIDNFAENIYNVIRQNNFEKVSLFYNDNIIGNDIKNTLKSIFNINSDNDEINGMQTILKEYYKNYKDDSNAIFNKIKSHSEFKKYYDKINERNPRLDNIKKLIKILMGASDINEMNNDISKIIEGYLNNENTQNEINTTKNLIKNVKDEDEKLTTIRNALGKMSTAISQNINTKIDKLTANNDLYNNIKIIIDFYNNYENQIINFLNNENHTEKEIKDFQTLCNNYNNEIKTNVLNNDEYNKYNIKNIYMEYVETINKISKNTINDVDLSKKKLKNKFIKFIENYKINDEYEYNYQNFYLEIYIKIKFPI